MVAYRDTRNPKSPRIVRARGSSVRYSEVLVETAYVQSPHVSELRGPRVLFERFPNVVLIQIRWIIEVIVQERRFGRRQGYRKAGDNGM